MLHFLLSPWSAFWNISFPWFYFSGIYHEPKCRKDTLDHGLLLVGYGYEGHESENRKYWLLKNRYMLWKLLDFKIRMDFLLAVGFLDTSHRTHCCIKLKKEHVLFCCSNLCVCECGVWYWYQLSSSVLSHLMYKAQIFLILEFSILVLSLCSSFQLCPGFCD